MATEEQLRILKMIEEGKITAAQGAELLAALGEAEEDSPKANDVKDARWLRVHVTDSATGRSKVSVRVPFALVSAGLKVGAHFAPELKGIDWNEIISALRSGEHGKMVDVVDEEDGEHVEIYLE
jgi:hypothetical protein